MRIACSLGSLLSVEQVIECTKMISETNIDSIWIPETWGMENFSMLGAISSETKNQKIGLSQNSLKCFNDNFNLASNDIETLKLFKK